MRVRVRDNWAGRAEGKSASKRGTPTGMASKINRTCVRNSSSNAHAHRRPNDVCVPAASPSHPPCFFLLLSARHPVGSMELIRFLAQDVDIAAHVESLTRLAVLFLPANSPQSELYLETAHAVAELMSMIREHHKHRRTRLPATASEISSMDQHPLFRDPLHRQSRGPRGSWRDTLQTLPPIELAECVQLVFEMAVLHLTAASHLSITKQRQALAHWGVVLAIELFKLRCRLQEQRIPRSPIFPADRIFLLRPIAYVLLLYGLGRRSWIPWTVSLAMDLAAERLPSSPFIPKSSLRLLLYLVRSPLFDRLVKPLVLRLPFFRTSIGYYLDLQQLYFYTS